MNSLPPYLTDDEIAEICRPLRQGAAQIRFLRDMGIRVTRRGDGTPLVWRCDAERRTAAPLADGATVGAANEPNWSRKA